MASGFLHSHCQGNEHGDTEAFDDIAAFNINPSTIRIYKLQVWASDTVKGVKVWYNNNGTNMKAKHRSAGGRGVESHVINFAADEHITYFGGRSGNIIDFLEVRTNKG
jgi:hypothetical protein